jgi:hypothetical protein
MKIVRIIIKKIKIIKIAIVRTEEEDCKNTIGIKMSIFQMKIQMLKFLEK